MTETEAKNHLRSHQNGSWVDSHEGSGISRSNQKDLETVRLGAWLAWQHKIQPDGRKAGGCQRQCQCQY